MQKELIFGSKEWIEELNNRVQFPSMFAVYYGIHKETNEGILHIMIVRTKSKNPLNVKMNSVKKTLSMSLSPYKWALIDVYYIESVEDYIAKLKELSNCWGVKFN